MSAETALRERERDLTMLGENFPEGALYQYIVTGDGRRLITYLGQGVERIFGELPAQLPVDVAWLTARIHPEDEPAMAAAGLESQRALAPFHHDVRIRRLDGRLGWASFRTRPRASSDLSVVWDGVIVDITERRLAEESARRQNQFLAALNETTLELLSRRNVPELLQALVTRASALFASPHVDLSLLEGGELVVRAYSPSFAAFVGDRVPRSESAVSWRAVETLAPVVVDDYGAATEGRSKYKALGLTAVAIFPIVRDGVCVGVLGLGRDRPYQPFTADEVRQGMSLAQMVALVLHNAAIHAEAVREAEARTAALRESEEHFRGVFDQSPIIIGLLTVPEGRIAAMNAAGLAAFGYAREEMIGRSSLELNLWADPTVRDRYLAELRARGTASGFEVVMRRKDGSTFVGLYTGSIIRIGGLPYSLNMLQDVTAHRQAETALRESEERFRAVFDESPIGIGLFAMPEGRTVELNAAAHALLGFDRDELIGHSTRELAVWVEPAARDRYVEMLAAQGVVRDFETSFRRKDGTTVTALVSGSLVTLGGKPYSLASIHDITARKRSEAARDRSLALTRATLESTADGILVVNADGHIDTYNQNFAEMWRLTSRLAHTPADEDGLIHQILDQLVSPERFLASVRDLYTGSEDEVFDVLHCKDGRVFERYSHPQILGNHPSGRVWSFRDITERLAAEAALRQSEERFRLLAEVSPVGIFSSDPNGRTTFVNRRWCELAGLTPEQALGDGWQTALHPEDRRQVAEGWAEAVRAGESSAAEFRFVRPDGATSWLVGQSRAHRRSDGTLAGYVGTITDVTNLKQAEDEQKRIEAQLRQARKMESLGTLAGGIAHDFNNILNGTFGFIDLARLELEPGHPVNAWLDRMAASSQRARDLVRQILTFSRKSEGERVPQHLHLVVGEALRLLRSSLPAMVELEARVHANTPAVLADSTQIHQVVLNLCTNAAHALPKRGGRIKVTLEGTAITPERAATHPDLRVGPAVRLAVTDNGSGMDATVLDHIFEPFFTTKETGAGTGLGLAVVHGIVKSHEGAIVVCSAPGQGSTFEIFFPAVAAEPEAVVPSREIPRGHGERVLVVDDDNVSGFVIEKLVESLGYQTSRETHPETALARITAYPAGFDLLISDLAMPGMNGEELIGHVARIRPDLPIMVVSGFLENARQRLLDQGIARAVLSKPVSRDELARGIAVALAR